MANVLILIILEVLYEGESMVVQVKRTTVLILIILEVLYEFVKRFLNDEDIRSLNPYYTGSTL